jgi:ribosomal protein S18 acetylase RimI-like enzyme
MRLEEFVELPQEIEAEMLNDLQQYGVSHGVHMNYNKYSFVLKDDTGRTTGILSFYTIFAEVFIDMLWVDGKYRKKGLGRMLLRELEERSKNKGFNNINLCTYAFQAPEFYKKCGFELEFVRKNKQNPCFSKYFFVKFLGDAVQKQGIL